MRKQSKKYNKESSKYDKKKKKGDKKDDKKGQIPIEKLKFATGDNQAENYERLKRIWQTSSSKIMEQQLHI